MHRWLGVLLVAALGSVQAFEVELQHAEPLFGEDTDLSLTTLRGGAGLPWLWRLGGGWLALSRVDASLGRLEGRASPVTPSPWDTGLANTCASATRCCTCPMAD